ncbi:MAG TPA: hypothetical protein VGW12_19175 [Pyrinomonadaceae bacterium]|nr:hypothetical protein [Pyrinomonadaceae bacterium]
MSKKRHLLFILLILVGSALGGAISNKLLMATPALARPGEESSNRPQWEHCALTRAAYVNAGREDYWIIYFRETGPQVVDVQSSATDGSGASMAKAISRLGADGWEMVGQGPLDLRTGATNALYFKRRK